MATKGKCTMHIKQLERFVQLAQTLSFSRTADLLFVTQPTITHQINTLEDDLGIRLFIRSTRKVELTPAGASFYNDMSDVLARINNAIAKAKNYSLEFESNISIGYEGNNEVCFLPAILMEFKKQFPHVHIDLKMANFKERRSQFDNLNIDVVFTVKENIKDMQDIGYVEMFTGRFVCVMAKNHALAGMDQISIEDLCQQSLISLSPMSCPAEMARIQQSIQLQHPSATVYFSDNALIACTMIKAGFGIAVMPDFACPADPELVVVPMEISDKISYGLAWHKKNERAEINGFIQIARQIYHLDAGVPDAIITK
jgi:LysR family hca operon transcriptional activator